MDNLKVDELFIDKISGKNADRPQLKKLLEFIRRGDVLIVESISRFARNTKDLLELIELLNNKEVSFISVKENIDTNTPTGKFMITVFWAVAELEREYILQRQREGIAIAKQQGKYKGRNPKVLVNYDAVVSKWKNGSITATKAAKTLGISRNTFYRKLK